MQLGPGFLGDVLSIYSSLLANILEFVVIALGLYLVGRVVVETVGRWSLERSKFDETMVDGVMSVLRLAVVLLAFVGAGAADFRGAFAGSALIAGGVTLAVSSGAQDVLGNFVADAFLGQDPDVNIGDRIAGRTGRDHQRHRPGRRARAHARERAIIVPDEELSTSVVTNHTSHDPSRSPTSSRSGTAN